MSNSEPERSHGCRDADALIEAAIANKPRAQEAWALLPGEHRDRWRCWVGKSRIRWRRRRRAAEFARVLDLLPSYSGEESAGSPAAAAVIDVLGRMLGGR
jgi:hypothetical protein